MDMPDVAKALLWITKTRSVCGGAYAEFSDKLVDHVAELARESRAAFTRGDVSEVAKIMAAAAYAANVAYEFNRVLSEGLDQESAILAGRALISMENGSCDPAERLSTLEQVVDGLQQARAEYAAQSADLPTPLTGTGGNA